MKNDDLISRSALLAAYDRVHVGQPGGARKLIEDAPTVDAVEVVRCKDCVYSIQEGWFCLARQDFRTFPNSFCSEGAKPTQENEVCEACRIRYSEEDEENADK